MAGQWVFRVFIFSVQGFVAGADGVSWLLNEEASEGMSLEGKAVQQIGEGRWRWTLREVSSARRRIR